MSRDSLVWLLIYYMKNIYVDLGKSFLKCDSGAEVKASVHPFKSKLV